MNEGESQYFEHAPGVTVSIVHVASLRFAAYSVVMGGAEDESGRLHLSGATTDQVAPSAMIQGF